MGQPPELRRSWRQTRVMCAESVIWWSVLSGAGRGALQLSCRRPYQVRHRHDHSELSDDDVISG